MYIFTHVCAWWRYFFGNCEWVGCWIWLFQVKERFNCWSWWPVSALSKWGKIVAFVRRQGKCRVHKKSKRTKMILLSKMAWSVDFWLFSEQPSQCHNCALICVKNISLGYFLKPHGTLRPVERGRCLGERRDSSRVATALGRERFGEGHGMMFLERTFFLDCRTYLGFGVGSLGGAYGIRGQNEIMLAPALVCICVCTFIWIWICICICICICMCICICISFCIGICICICNYICICILYLHACSIPRAGQS